jgi:N-acetylglucosaminyl-diphospho-decaprenol L-rhamnosyltransferase
MTIYELTAIVVSFNSAHVLQRCIEALHAQGAKVIVVDNASDDGSVTLAEKLGAHVIRNTLNQGYGRANNQGIRAATTPYALIVNPDLVIEDGALAALMDAASRYPEAGIIAPTIKEPSGRIFFQPRSLLSKTLHNPRGVLHVPDFEACTPFVSGACLLIKRDVFLAIGGFDENIFLFYEDDDLCRRMMDHGFHVIFVPQARALHLRGQSSSPARGRVYKSRWHQAWSRAYVSRKYNIKSTCWRDILINFPKVFANKIIARHSGVERYGGTVAGAWAFLRGQTALEKEGLETER